MIKQFIAKCVSKWRARRSRAKYSDHWIRFKLKVCLCKLNTCRSLTKEKLDADFGNIVGKALYGYGGGGIGGGR